MWNVGQRYWTARLLFCFSDSDLQKSIIYLFLTMSVNGWVGCFNLKTLKNLYAVFELYETNMRLYEALVWRITYALLYLFKILYPHYVVPFLLKKAQKELCLPSVCEKDFMKLRLLHLCLSLFLFNERLNVCS